MVTSSSHSAEASQSKDGVLTWFALVGLGLTAMLWAAMPVNPAIHAATRDDNIVLDFTASWCGPCREMKPVVERLARMGYRIRAVDIDKEPQLARQYRIESVPTFVLVVNGQEANRIQGSTSDGQLIRMLQQIPSDGAANSGGSGALASSARSQPSRPLAFAGVRQAANGMAIDLGEAGQWPASVGRRGDSAMTPPVQQAVRPPARQVGNGAQELGARVPGVLPNSRIAGPFSPRNGAVFRGQQPDQDAAPGGPGGASKAMASTVRLRVKDATGVNYGSGTIIASQIGQATIVTCGHVFRKMSPETTIEVDVFTGKVVDTFAGTVVDFDLEGDVGLLTIPAASILPSSPMAFATMKPKPQTDVFSIGCGGGENPTQESMRVTALNRYQGPDNIECTGVPVQGRSGGGLFTNSGELVGVCIAADPKDKRGLYAGLKPVEALLKKNSLEQLCRSNSESRGPLAAATDSQTDVPGAERAASELFNNGPLVPTVETREIPTASRVNAPSGPSLADAMASGADAEVICIVRSRTNPQASRVVIINRASSKFNKYLSDEVSANAAE